MALRESSSGTSVSRNPSDSSTLPRQRSRKAASQSAYRLSTRTPDLLRKTGARGLRSILEGMLLDTMFDLPSMDGVDEIVIDKDVVDGRKDPVRVFAKKKKEAGGDAA